MGTFQDTGVSLAKEAVYGTFVPGTKGYEILGDQLSQTYNKNAVQGAGLRVGGRFPRSARRYVASSDGTIVLPIELISKGMGTLLEACLGSAVSTLTTGTTYQHNFTLGDTPPSLSVQEQIVQRGGTIDAYSWTGCMVDSVEFTFNNVGLATLSATLDCKDVTTAQAYVAPVYPTTPNLFHFANLSLYTGVFTAATATTMPSAATPTANIRSASVTLNRNLIKDSFNGGNAGKKAKPPVGAPSATGSMVVEYDSTTYRDLVLNDGALTLVITLTAGALSSGLETFTLALPCIKLDGQLPPPNNDQLVLQQLDFTVLDDLTNVPFGISMRTADATI